MKRVLFHLTVLFSAVFGLASQAIAQNDLLVTTVNGNGVARFDAETGENLGMFVQSGSGGLNGALSVAVGPDGNVYVTSGNTSQVLRYDGQTGNFIDVFASGSPLNAPNNIEFHGDHMYVGNFAGGSSGGINRFDASTGTFVDKFVQANNIDGFTFLDDSILVSSFSSSTVSRYDLSTGAFLEEFASAGEGGLVNPTDILELANGEVLIGSYSTNSIKRYSSSGAYLGDAITGISGPEGLAIGPNGNLFAGSYNQGFINEYNPETFELIGRFATVGGNTNFFTFRTTAVPEPGAGLILLFGGGLAFLRNRRRR